MTSIVQLFFTIAALATEVPSYALQGVPIRQSELSVQNAGPPQPLTLEDAARDDRWIGVSPRAVRWALDGSGVYFRWHESPSTEDDGTLDPWFWVR